MTILCDVPGCLRKATICENAANAQYVRECSKHHLVRQYSERCERERMYGGYQSLPPATGSVTEAKYA